MYNRVILTEKPDMGLNIAQALGLKSKGRHYHVLHNGDVVTWAIGHVIQLKEPKTYPQYAEWTLESLPFVPDPVLTEVDPAKKDQMKAIRELVNKAKCVVIATDAGREGEHIARLVLQECGYPVTETGRALRLWVADLTPDTIQKAYANMKPASFYDNLAAAAQVRSTADYWMGITATRFFTLKVQAITKERTILSAGRVQTPTLRIVYDREMAIQNFKPQPFYYLISEFQTSSGKYTGQWFRVDEEGNPIYRFDTQEKADGIRRKVQGNTGSVIRYVEKEVKRQAPQLLSEGALKAEARKQLGFSLKKTTKVLQAVYDKHFCSYPRTSSRHMSENAADQLVEWLNKLKATSKYQHYFPRSIESIKGKKRFVDNSKVMEHHAIVPTDQDPDHFKDHEMYKLTSDEEKLYELILRHTLAAFHPEGIDKETEVVTSVVDENFYSKSVAVLVPGWRKIMKVEQEADNQKDDLEENQQAILQKIPQLQEGQSASVNKIEALSGKTSKPKRFYDSDLQRAMEFAGRLVDEEAAGEEIMEYLKAGIGTPATRTETINTLAHQKYIEIDSKNLVYLTDKGKHFMELIYEHPLASIELTGEFERKLNDIADGVRSAESLLEEFKAFANQILSLENIMDQRITAMMQGNKKLSLFSNIEEIGSCPLCGKPVIEGSKGYGCSGYKDGCKFTIWKEFRNVKLREKQVRDLLQGKEILLKDVPPSVEGKKPYDLVLFLVEGNLQNRFPSLEDNSVGDCPSCGKPVTEKDKSYSCSGYREGCKFSIWKQYRNIDLPKKAIKTLLVGKEVLLQNIPPTDPSKKNYDLVVFLKNGQIQSRFPSAADNTVGACPLCKNPVVETATNYSCSTWKTTGCKFRLGKEFLGVKITSSQMKKILKNGKSDKLEGFKGGKTGSFDTALGYDPAQNRYSFVR
ncbi:DNA topoisomerase [Paenibacillus sp. 1P03SA]|uniref:DNA topoisomerase n=1 Tax=Paenibacillus sp. 1P03SA TaxID=3132294 RepID=UPI0039A3688C